MPRQGRAQARVGPAEPGRSSSMHEWLRKPHMTWHGSGYKPLTDRFVQTFLVVLGSSLRMLQINCDADRTRVELGLQNPAACPWTAGLET